MAQKGLDLGTAMMVFFNGNPERYNYMRKDKVPLDARERCLVLDAVHRRVVSGFYLPDPDNGVVDIFPRILEWVERQEHDRALGRTGRWTFDPALFTPISLSAVQADRDDDDPITSPRRLLSPVDARDVLKGSDLHDTGKQRKPGLWRDLLGPLLG